MDGLKKLMTSLNLTCVTKVEFTVEGSCLIWGNKVAVPFQLRKKVFTELHENESFSSFVCIVARYGQNN